jgi:hypothetical protein
MHSSIHAGRCRRFLPGAEVLEGLQLLSAAVPAPGDPAQSVSISGPVEVQPLDSQNDHDGSGNPVLCSAPIPAPSVQPLADPAPGIDLVIRSVPMDTGGPERTSGGFDHGATPLVVLAVNSPPAPPVEVVRVIVIPRSLASAPPDTPFDTSSSPDAHSMPPDAHGMLDARGTPFVAFFHEAPPGPRPGPSPNAGDSGSDDGPPAPPAHDLANLIPGLTVDRIPFVRHEPSGPAPGGSNPQAAQPTGGKSESEAGPALGPVVVAGAAAPAQSLLSGTAQRAVALADTPALVASADIAAAVTSGASASALDRLEAAAPYDHTTAIVAAGLPLVRDVSGLVGRVLPWTGEQIVRAVDGLIDELPDLGAGWSDWGGGLNLRTSLVALAASAVVFEIGRRKLRQVSRYRLLEDITELEWVS